MKIKSWPFIFGVILITSSFLIYLLHFFIFKDLHHILIYLVGDIAFVPFEVLIVTLIIHRVLEVREKNQLKKKLNMVIGVFFNELGSELLKLLTTFCMNLDEIHNELLDFGKWNLKKFNAAGKKLDSINIKLNTDSGNLNDLKNFLHDKRLFLLSLMENPNLLEHQSFTDLLWAVFHLLDELEARDLTKQLGHNDCEHLSIDMKRAYLSLLKEWVYYLKHLKADYPYLFSLAVRLNPLDENACAVISERT